MRVLRVAVLITALPILLSGCELLFPSIYGSDPYAMPGDSYAYDSGKGLSR